MALSFDTEQLYDPAVKPEYRNLAEYRDDYLYTMRRFLKGDDNMLSGVLYEMRHIPANMGRIHYLSNYYGLTLMDMVSYDHKHNEANGEGNRMAMIITAAGTVGGRTVQTEKSAGTSEKTVTECILYVAVDTVHPVDFHGG